MVFASSFIWEYGPKYDFGTREFRGLVFITKVTRTKSIHNLPFSVAGCWTVCRTPVNVYLQNICIICYTIIRSRMTRKYFFGGTYIFILWGYNPSCRMSNDNVFANRNLIIRSSTLKVEKKRRQILMLTMMNDLKYLQKMLKRKSSTN